MDTIFTTIKILFGALFVGGIMISVLEMIAKAVSAMTETDYKRAKRNLKNLERIVPELVGDLPGHRPDKICEKLQDMRKEHLPQLHQRQNSLERDIRAINLMLANLSNRRKSSGVIDAHNKILNILQELESQLKAANDRMENIFLGIYDLEVNLRAARQVGIPGEYLDQKVREIQKEIREGNIQHEISLEETEAICEGPKAHQDFLKRLAESPENTKTNTNDTEEPEETEEADNIVPFSAKEAS